MYNRTISSIDGNHVKLSMLDTSQRPKSDAFVTLCLFVPKQHHNAKGIKPHSNQAQFARPGEEKCLPVAPTMQRILLLSKVETGTSQRSMVFSANLTGFSGRTLRIEWIVEASQ